MTKFKLVDSNEVVTVETSYQIVLSHSTFRVGELTEALMQELSNLVTADYGGKQKERLEKVWFEQDTGCEMLRIGAKGWQKGKVRIRIALEFCPDEPEVEETLVTNEPGIRPPESLLDDIRRMMTENN